MLLPIIFGGRTAFDGKYAFNRKPSLVLVPIYAPDLYHAQIAEIRLRLEKELAAEGTHALFPRSLIENFYLEKENRLGVFDGSYLSKEESFELGNALGVERIATASILKYSGHLNIYLTVHDLATDQVVYRVTFESPDTGTLIEWTDLSGATVDLKTLMGGREPGMGISGRLYIIWLTALLLASASLLLGFPPPRIFIEAVLAGGILLALFSWIYALNGDMDYVQRFVATSGLLRIGDTAMERRATLIRYLIPGIPPALFWCSDTFRRIREQRTSGRIIAFPVLLEATAPLWAMLSSVLFSLSLPNFLVLEGLPVLAWIATAPLYLAIRASRFGRGFFLVIFFTGLQSLIINWWQGTFSYISLPITVGIMMVQSLPFSLILVFTAGRSRPYGLLAAPFLWVGWDWVRSLGFLGYPWGLLGVSQYAHPALLQSAAIGGVWVVNLLPHLSGAVLANTIESLEFRNPARLRRRAVPLFICVLGISVAALGGTLAIRNRDMRLAALPPDEAEKVRILLIQQNTDPRKNDYRLSFEQLSRLTEEAVAAQGPFDLVAWSESGFVPDIRFWLDKERSTWSRGQLVRAFLDWQEKMAIPLVTGTQDHFYEPAPPSDDPEAPAQEKRIQNSSMYLPPDRRDDSQRFYYYKIRLVPFTENFPYREQFPWVAELLHNFSTTQWTPGTAYTIHNAPEFDFSTPICFEDVFPDHLRHFALAGSEVFVNLSNDYWANTPLEGYQHGAHAVFRAVENRRPLVRSTSSGWTISVDTEGRIAEGWPPFYQPGWTVAEHYLKDEPEWTFYTRYGDWFPVLCLAIWGFLLITDYIKYRVLRQIFPRSCSDSNGDGVG